MSNRGIWKFKYHSDNLYNAVVAKIEHHKARLEWWKEQHKKVEEEIKTKGLTIHASLAVAANTTLNFSGSSSNAYQMPHVVIDNELQKNFNEAVGKIREHTQHVKTYEAWEDILKDETGDFELDYDDWHFFFGK